MAFRSSSSTAMRGHRACMVCSIVQPTSKFSSSGCPNCEDFLQLAGNPDAIQDATSAVFEGVIVMSNPDTSWVARWQRLQDYCPGLYATKVVGILPEDFITATENAGFRYVPRDGSGLAEEQ